MGFGACSVKVEGNTEAYWQILVNLLSLSLSNTFTVLFTQEENYNHAQNHTHANKAFIKTLHYSMLFKVQCQPSNISNFILCSFPVYALGIHMLTCSLP